MGERINSCCPEEPGAETITKNHYVIKNTAPIAFNPGYFFVHFSEGQLRPVACGALSFEGKNVRLFRQK